MRRILPEIRAYAARHGNALLVADRSSSPAGEDQVELHFVEAMQTTFSTARPPFYVIAVGGGAVLDAVGLVAATTHRGLRHIRVPTTVLSQNDSGVGVKNGVNLYEQKNFVGTFAPPFAVLNDLDFIDALPKRDKIAGMAEAVKVALIRDANFFGWLERSAVPSHLPARCHATISGAAPSCICARSPCGDPFETGSARPLDFGHWAAHRLETLTKYHLRHGEAVAIGMALDTRYSVLAGLLDAAAEQRIGFLLEHLGFRLWHSALENRMANGRHAVLEGLREFREHLGGELTVTLLSDIGVGVEVHEIDEALMRQAIDGLKQAAA